MFPTPDPHNRNPGVYVVAPYGSYSASGPNQNGSNNPFDPNFNGPILPVYEPQAPPYPGAVPKSPNGAENQTDARIEFVELQDINSNRNQHQQQPYVVRETFSEIPMYPPTPPPPFAVSNPTTPETNSLTSATSSPQSVVVQPPSALSSLRHHTT
jgi:hypothetical protein